MNRLVVYVGPTISAEEVRRIAAEAEVLPPVESGSLLRERFGAGDVVVILDGYYRDRPSVRHKEILQLVGAGVVVIGAASMGALRAAELDGFGVRGVGRVYEWYRSGRVWGDDEVAVKHMLDGYRGQSVALVNLRYGCEVAVRKQVVGAPVAEVLIDAAKSLVFDERSWSRIRQVAGGRLDREQAGELDRLVAFCRDTDYDLKAQDARLAVATARDLLGQAPDRARPGQVIDPAQDPGRSVVATPLPPPTTFLTGWMHYWGSASMSPSGDWVSDLDVLDAVRLFVDDYPVVHQQVLGEMLAEIAGRELGEAASPGRYISTILGLTDRAVLPDRLGAYLSAQERQLPTEEQATLAAIRGWSLGTCPDWRPRVIDRLKADPAWPRWGEIVSQADQARRHGPRVPERAAGLVFLRRWGVSGPAIGYELGRRGFLTMEFMSRTAQRYASLEIQQRSRSRQASRS